MAELIDNIETAASQPKRAAGDQGSVEVHSIPDQIAADKYVKNATAGRKAFGVKCAKIIPGSTTD